MLMKILEAVTTLSDEFDAQESKTEKIVDGGTRCRPSRDEWSRSNNN